MNRLKRMLSLLLVLSVFVSVCAVMTGCGGDKEGDDPTKQTESTAPSQTTPSGEKSVYRVEVESAGGMAMSEVSVYVYADSSKTDLVDFGETDSNGSVSFEMNRNSDYVVELQGVPEGYRVEEYYSFTGNAAKISLTSGLITDKTLSDLSAADALGVGDVMCDLTVTDSNQKEIKLSDVLAEKKVVLLNFWYSTCGPCASEFPYMEEAYQTYQDKAAVIAVNPLEDAATVATYQASMQLSFTMAACPMAWTQPFGVQNYPTTVVIDRYGVICLMEVGALPSLSPFISIFDHFTADDYQQKLFPNGVADIVSQIKPDQTMDTSENVGAVLNQGDINVTYRADEDEYSWPFVVTDKNGQISMMASNQGIENSYAILYADVELKAGQAVGFDYLASTENGGDYMHVIVNKEAIFSISGVDEVEAWKSCYPCVATKDGVYEIALCYYKDESDNAGDDTVYIRNLRVVGVDEIDTPAHLPRQAATTENFLDYEYVDIFLNDKDGYYHVGSVDGPLLLVDMMGDTQFSEEDTLWNLVYEGNIFLDGKNLYDLMTNYFSYSSNSSLYGVCTVNYELGEYLKYVITQLGGEEIEWLKLCKYYQAYGKGAEQLEDPIKGLAPFSAPDAVLGKNKPENVFYYNTAIIPRGKLAKFVPTKSGVYRITSRNESQHGVNGWIFDGNRNVLLTYEQDERLFNDSNNVSMVFYMQAGEAYYIDIAFWDVYEVGYIYFDIEYVAPTLEHFRLASPGYFTYDSDATGDTMYYTIAGGIDVALGDDGYYHHVKSKDENGNPVELGSIVYADFVGVTSLFSHPICTVNSLDDNGNVILDENGNPVQIKGMIDLGGFDFSKDSEGEAASGPDLTEEIRGYVNKCYSGSARERVGCVPVDARLAEILQLLMDKYTFAGVDHSWTKLCYYYDYLGPDM